MHLNDPHGTRTRTPDPHASANSTAATGLPQSDHSGGAPQPMPHPQPPHNPPPHETAALLGLRSALILTLGALVGAGAAVLTHLAQHNAAAAGLAGGGAFAGAVLFFHTIIAPDKHTR